MMQNTYYKVEQQEDGWHLTRYEDDGSVVDDSEVFKTKEEAIFCGNIWEWVSKSLK